MAGLGSRFKNVGYNCEKYEIMFHNRTLFEWAILSLQNFFSADFIFITNNNPQIEEFINSKVKDLGITHYEIRVLDYQTRGQAETALQAGIFFREDDCIIIYNIDTYINPDFLSPTMIHGAGWIPVFSSLGDHWSFVAADSDGRATSVTEKIRISDNCSLGLYYFKSFYHFQDLVKRYVTGDSFVSSFTEWYIAPLYNYLIKEGEEVFIQIIPKEQVMVLGTPEELAAAENCGELDGIDKSPTSSYKKIP